MPRIACAAACLIVLVSHVHAQTGNKKAPTKKDADLPNVALVIPEETRPEVKAILKEQVIALRSKKAADRKKGAEVLGELGVPAKPARRLLCGLLLDQSEPVRVAAADALKNIDTTLHQFAVELATGGGGLGNGTTIERIGELKDEGEPLTPLVYRATVQCVASNNVFALQKCITTLSRIARNDQDVCKIIMTGLSHSNADVRLTAVRVLPSMKHGKQAVPKLLALLRPDAGGGPGVVIVALAELSDPSNEETITKAISAQRYHQDPYVRKAVESSLNKIKAKGIPNP
jgi:HEAT repeat protein